jgi:hypothetical protein
MSRFEQAFAMQCQTLLLDVGCATQPFDKSGLCLGETVGAIAQDLRRNIYLRNALLSVMRWL